MISRASKRLARRTIISHHHLSTVAESSNTAQHSLAIPSQRSVENKYEAYVHVPSKVGDLPVLFAVIREVEKRYGRIAEFRCPKDADTGRPGTGIYIRFQNATSLASLGALGSSGKTRFDVPDPRPRAPFRPEGAGLKELKSLIPRYNGSVNPTPTPPQNATLGERSISVEIARNNGSGSTPLPKFQWNNERRTRSVVAALANFSGFSSTPTTPMKLVMKSWKTRARALKVDTIPYSPLPKTPIKRAKDDDQSPTWLKELVQEAKSEAVKLPQSLEEPESEGPEPYEPPEVLQLARRQAIAQAFSTPPPVTPTKEAKTIANSAPRKAAAPKKPKAPAPPKKENAVEVKAPTKSKDEPKAATGKRPMEKTINKMIRKGGKNIAAVLESSMQFQRKELERIKQSQAKTLRKQREREAREAAAGQAVDETASVASAPDSTPETSSTTRVGVPGEKVSSSAKESITPAKEEEKKDAIPTFTTRVMSIFGR